MEKMTGTSMKNIAAWGDQKVAAFFKDFKKEEPEQDPAPFRALFRVLFLIILIVGLSLSLAYLFWEAPDVQVKHETNLQGRNKDYPVGKLYNKSIGQPYDPISCPCTLTSTNFSDLVNFYLLYEDSAEWSIDYNSNVHPPSITVPDVNVSQNQLAGHVQLDPVPLTAEYFCNNISYLWPVNATIVAELSSSQWYVTCLIAAAVIPTTSNTSTSLWGPILLDTPILLNEEALVTSINQLFQANLLSIQSIIATDVANPTARMYSNALMSFMMGVPVVSGVGNLLEDYYSGALYQSDLLNFIEAFNSPNPSILVLNTSKGIASLQLSVDWMTHYKKCNPLYCELTRPMGYLKRLYWAVGLLGGTVTIVLALVNIVLWPATVFVLGWIHKNQKG